MKRITLLTGFFALFLIPAFVQAQISDEEKKDKFVSLFDGKTLDGWKGNPAIWSVQNGMIVGQTAQEGDAKLTYNQFLIHKDEVGNFVFRADIKLSPNGNSGFQYRSFEGNRPYSVSGYQADFDGVHTFSGILYGEGFGGILTNRGTESTLADGPKRVGEKRFAEDGDLKKELKVDDWNSYEIVADGFQFTHTINGKTVSVTKENGEGTRKAKGLLAIQIHVTAEPMKVEIKNIRIKRLP